MQVPKIFKKSPLINAVIAAIVVIVIAVIFALSWYASQLAPVSTSQTAKLFVIQKGTTMSEVASDLEEAKLIRNAWAFQTYVKVQGLGEKFQAGTYALAPNQSSQSIVKTLTKGKVTSVLVTILPGKRIDQIRTELINDGFAPDEVDKALDPDQYSNLPIMAIKPPQVVTLEGLLWPDSFQKDQTTEATDIIKQSLIEMGEHITPEVETQFAAQGLTPYQGVTMASIIEQEVNNPNDQTKVSQVFYTRLKKGMPLGSDVTARYGAISAGLEPSLTYDSPYNTLIHTGLPPTPISTINKNSLYAATHPATTNWLFFVTGDDGVTHFTSTVQEHDAAAAKYCHKLCSL